MAVFIFALDVLQFFTNDEKSWVRINYAVNASKSYSLRSLSGVSKSVWSIP